MNRTHHLALGALALGTLLGTGCASKAKDVKPTVEVTQPAPKPAVAQKDTHQEDAAASGAQDPAAQQAANDGAGARALDFPTVHFEFDSDVLTADGRAALDQFAQGWRQKGEKRGLTIGGHTDERGSEEYNLVLGQRRANAVRQYLARLGCPEEAIKTISYGENQPLDDAHSETAFAKNRRVEVKAN